MFVNHGQDYPLGPNHEETNSVLRAVGLTKTFPGIKALDGVDFRLRAGEVHGLVGENGAGRSTLVNLLTGVHQPDRGKIPLDERPVFFSSPREAADAGIRVIHQELAFVGPLDVATNFSLGSIPLRPERLSGVLGLVDRDEMARRADAALAEIGHLARKDTLVETPNVLARALSGGNQQKLLLARLVATEPKIMILDEPTRGIDVGSKIEVWRLIKGLADEGASVLTISTEVSDLIGNVDRVLVMKRGTLVAEFSGDEISEASIVSQGI